MILIVMGVAGSGKTTIAKALVAFTGWQFAEGDDYHSEANRKKMHSGVPLNDDDRAPWLASLHAALQGWYESGQSGVMTCSALKQKYRDVLSGGLPADAYRFVLLEAPPELLQERLSHRQGHFMNPGLLASQLATLEDPKDALHVSVEQAPEVVAKQILDRIKGQS
jgi:gluconokinase